MINENIRHFRKAKGISQEEMAVKLNVVRQTVSKWENGLSVPDADVLIHIAQLLDVSVSQLLGIALLGSCLVSYLKFDTANPFSAAISFIKITVVDKDYVEIQSFPKVILAQPDDTLFVEYMQSRGFTEIEEKRMGALRVFTNGEEKEWIMYSVNGYFAKWTWE